MRNQAKLFEYGPTGTPFENVPLETINAAYTTKFRTDGGVCIKKTYRTELDINAGDELLICVYDRIEGEYSDVFSRSMTRHNTITIPKSIRDNLESTPGENDIRIYFSFVN